jgi:hypothetical protein
MSNVAWIGAQKEFEAQWMKNIQWCYAFEDTRAAQGATGK